MQEPGRNRRNGPPKGSPPRFRVVLFAALIVALAASTIAAPPAIPTPKDVLGFVPGENRKLADYASVAEYFRRLAATSDRVRVEEIGQTTLGRPMLLTIISSRENLARLDRLRDIQRRLADPRTIATDDEARALISEGRAVVLVTYGIHSIEVGSTLSSTVLAHQLATDDSAETREILDSCLVLIVPSLNPDGVDIIKNWYDSTLGTPWEGADPVEIYHHYTGHDNNRDWYAFTQRETRAVVERVHNVWRPQIVNDVHQQGMYGSRLFLPPYLDPIEPNVPAEIVAGTNAIGTSIAWSLTASGKPGVVTNAIYDAWTPARAYSHYHGGIRILSETASARIATPINIAQESLRPARGYDARQASANFPKPWTGGQWGLQDIVAYMTDASRAILLYAARNRELLLTGFYHIGRNAVTHGEGEPFAFVVPPDPALLRETKGADAANEVRSESRAWLLDTLARADVEIRIARANFKAGAREFPAGSAVIAFDQPYGAFAKALLERQHYPDLRQYVGGPPVVPYDVTAHTLSLLMGFESVRIDQPFALPTADAYPTPRTVDAPPAKPLLGGRRIGLYNSATASMDEGWTRWMFDRFGVAYTRLADRDIRAGQLRARFDAIIIPDLRPEELSAGRAPGTAPPETTGGLGRPGAEALSRFVEEGGTLVALNNASTYVGTALDLAVRDATINLPRAAYYCPGSILEIDVDTSSPIAAGIAPQSIAWTENGPIFDITEGKGVHVIARFAAADRLLQSGWLLGADRLAGKPALLEITKGRGRAILFAFRPQYRGQSLATLPFLLNALER